MHNPAGASFAAQACAQARTCRFACIAIVFAAVLSGCSSSGGKEEHAYVSFPEAALRDRVAPVYNKTGTVHNGERVVVLERMLNRRFVRVRSPRGEEGWIQDRYLADQKTFDQLQHLADQFKDAPAQAAAVTKRQTNLHALPGRQTAHLYQLAENQKVDVLRRQTADKNAPAPSTQQKTDKKEADSEPSSGEEEVNEKPGQAPVLEDWWLVRDSQKHIGWALGGLLYVDLPTDVATYAEGHRISAFFVLDQVRDGDKSIPEYLVLLTENHDGLPYDFDQVRVFTWNTHRHRYETAFRESGLSGFLPVTMGKENFGKEGDLHTFQLQVADASGNLREVKYKFNPPIVRQVLGPGEQPPPKVHHKIAKPKRIHSR
ncbi:MAG TPA: SH3 domain-containing protein [Candidatus Angelobacter sp.]